jgi:hypothetical protein
MNRHLAGFFNNLIKRNRHGASLAHTMNFDKGEAGAGEKTGETVSQKIFANCPCREAKAELSMKNAE